MWCVQNSVVLQTQAAEKTHVISICVKRMLLFTSSIDTCPVIFCKQQTCRVHVYITVYCFVSNLWGWWSRNTIWYWYAAKQQQQHELRWWFGAIIFIWINSQGYAVRSVLSTERFTFQTYHCHCEQELSSAVYVEVGMPPGGDREQPVADWRLWGLGCVHINFHHPVRVEAIQLKKM